MKKYIVKENSNYADEFDVEGFILTEGNNEEEVFQKLIDNYIENDWDLEEGDELKFPLEIYFGTNEAVEYYNMEDLKESIKIQEITQQEYNIIKNILGNSYGMVCFINQW